MLDLVISAIWLLAVSFSFGRLVAGDRLLSIPVGLGVLCALSLFLNLVDQINVLSYSVLAVIAYAVKGISLPKISIDRLALAIGILVVIQVLFFYHGATKYPWLEDDDPYVHAVGTEWISATGSFSRSLQSISSYKLYIEPYPPFFDVVTSLMFSFHENGIIDSLKFSNAFLVGLTLIPAFLFFSEVLEDRRKGLFAVFVLFCLPSFMSHFIWSQTLAMLFMFTGLYYGIKFFKSFISNDVSKGSISKENIGFALASAFAVLTQPFIGLFVPVILGFMGMIYSAAAGFGKIQFKGILFIGAIVALFFILYYGPLFLSLGWDQMFSSVGGRGIYFTDKTADTSGGVVYSLEDFVFPKDSSKIDQQIGIGIGVVLVGLIGLYLSVKRFELIDIFFMGLLLFTIIGTEGNLLPVKFFPHRFWVLLSIPLAFFVTKGVFSVSEKSKTPLVIIAILGLLVFFTSFPAKYAVQTAQWNYGSEWKSPNQTMAYLSIGQQMDGQKVYSACDVLQSKVISSGMVFEQWKPELEAELMALRDSNQSLLQTVSNLKNQGYNYFIVDVSCAENQQILTDVGLGVKQQSFRVIGGLENELYLLQVE